MQRMQMKHSCIVGEPVESTEENKNKQIQTIMNTNNKNNTWGGQTYETPTVKELDIQSEGVLCGSYGDANQAGKTLQESEDSSWDF